MKIVLRAEHEELLQEAIHSGVAHTPDEALDQAFDMLRQSLHRTASERESSMNAVRRLASFGKRNGLSLGGMTVKELLRESRA